MLRFTSKFDGTATRPERDGEGSHAAVCRSWASWATDAAAWTAMTTRSKHGRACCNNRQIALLTTRSMPTPDSRCCEIIQGSSALRYWPPERAPIVAFERLMRQYAPRMFSWRMRVAGLSLALFITLFVLFV